MKIEEPAVHDATDVLPGIRFRRSTRTNMVAPSGHGTGMSRRACGGNVVGKAFIPRPTGLVTWAAHSETAIEWAAGEFAGANSDSSHRPEVKRGWGRFPTPALRPIRTAALRFAEQLVSSTARIGCGTRSALGETKDGDPKRGLRLPLYARQDSNL